MSEIALPEQAAKLQGQAAGYVGMRITRIGLKTGLLEAIARHPDGVAPDALAKELDLDPFYVEVWARGAFGTELLEDAGEGRYTLAPHVGALLLDPTAPTYMAALFLVFDEPEVFDRFERELASGKRMWWDETGPDWITGVAETGRGFYNRLIPGGLDKIPGLRASLEEGAKVLELAAGVGTGLVKLAQAYPKATLVGLDGDAYSLEVARRNLDEAGLSQVELVHSTLEEADTLGHENQFDAVIINISMHEARDIERVTDAVRNVLAPGGVFVISDFPFPETPEALRSLAGRLMLGVQFFEAQIDDQLLPTRVYVELFERHGFRDVASFDVTPMHVVVHGRK